MAFQAICAPGLVVCGGLLFGKNNVLAAGVANQLLYFSMDVELVVRKWLHMYVRQNKYICMAGLLVAWNTTTPVFLQCGL